MVENCVLYYSHLEKRSNTTHHFIRDIIILYEKKRDL